MNCITNETSKVLNYKIDEIVIDIKLRMLSNKEVDTYQEMLQSIQTNEEVFKAYRKIEMINKEEQINDDDAFIINNALIKANKCKKEAEIFAITSSTKKNMLYDAFIKINDNIITEEEKLELFSSLPKSIFEEILKEVISITFPNPK